MQMHSIPKRMRSPGFWNPNRQDIPLPDFPLAMLALHLPASFHIRTGGRINECYKIRKRQHLSSRAVWQVAASAVSFRFYFLFFVT
jgi:hypothetical protein